MGVTGTAVDPIQESPVLFVDADRSCLRVALSYAYDLSRMQQYSLLSTRFIPLLNPVCIDRSDAPAYLRDFFRLLEMLERTRLCCIVLRIARESGCDTHSFLL